MGLIQAIILGFIQGITEFLPISSSAHLRIFPALFGWKDPGAAFTAVIQIGTLVAVLVYFRTDLALAFSAWACSIRDKEKRKTSEARIGWAIFVGTLPIVALGLALKKVIEGDAVRSLYVIASTLIGMGILLYVAERMGRHKRAFNTVKPADGLSVGLWQALALVPGCSRSGSTISGALFAGFDRPTAARFSFLLSVPSVLLAALFEAWTERHAIFQTDLAPVLVATVVAFVVGYWSIGFLMRYLQNNSTLIFAGYRVVLGVFLLGLLMYGPLRTKPQAPSAKIKPAHSHHVSA